MRVTLAFSSCPNDTFMFHAMVHSLVDTEGLEFDITISDVEDLNKAAQYAGYDISKMSYHGYFTVMESYSMLSCGSALGYDCGPLLVCREGDTSLFEKDKPRVAVPGMYTTGALLYKLAFSGKGVPVPMLFSDIEGAVGQGDVDMGVLIHEGRFTYRDKGLALVKDLGSWWQQTSSCPIPLGGIAVRSSLGDDFRKKVERVLRRSIEYAFANREASAGYVASYAQELSAEIQRKHIDMFVNRFSLELGEEGERAVATLKDYFLNL